jgi:hypothetical protein
LCAQQFNKKYFFILICFLFTKIFLSSRHSILFFPAPSSFNSCFVFYFSRLPAASSPLPRSGSQSILILLCPLNFIDLVGEEKSANVDI